MPAMNLRNILAELRLHADPANVAGMARYGIITAKAFGVGTPVLRAMGRRLGKDHALAAKLWATGLYEGRFLASLVDIPTDVTPCQMESWVADFDNWAICDGVCSNLFDKTPMAYEKALEWAARGEEFVKRAGFVMMACLAVHDKKAPDTVFIPFFDPILLGSADDRNFVRKAASWAMRQIGKNRPALRPGVIDLARRIRETGSKSGRWIASDVLRELERRA